MSAKKPCKSPLELATQIVQDAGGKITGRTRLQKIACLLELAGVGSGFHFEYKHYGPFSEELADAIRDAEILGFVEEKEFPTSWGGTYSVFTTEKQQDTDAPMVRKELIRIANESNPIELELAATAAFLKSRGSENPWEETKARKPEKAESGRLLKAKVLYERLRTLQTPVPLPSLSGV